MECDFLQHEIHKFLQIKPYNDKYEKKKDNFTINVLTFFNRFFTVYLTPYLSQILKTNSIPSAF